MGGPGRAVRMVLATVLVAVVAAPAAFPARAALAAVGVADSLTTKHDRVAVVAAPGVLGNDLNLLGGATAVLVSGVTRGTLDLRSNGGYTYTPDPGFVGTDSFRYKPSGVLSTAATVTIQVTNAIPVARPDAYSTPSGTALFVPASGVLTNDTDADGDALRAEIVDAGGISGSVDLEPNGELRYSPGGGFAGSLSFTYRVWDGVAWSGTTTVTLTVAAATPTPTPTPKPTPSPTPTPEPTPTPTPTPDPLPLPSLPLPPLPLPSLPLPLPSTGTSPTPEPGPAGPPTSSAPRASSEPSPSDGETSTPGQSDSDGGAAGLPSTGTDGFGDGGSAGEAANAVRPDGPRIAFDVPRLDLGSVGINLLAGIEIWSVPAATLAVPGILLIVWVTLQTIGALAWIPAVRRLRGEEEPAAP